MSDNLLACPFCGGPPERRLNTNFGDMSMVSCRHCGAEAYDRKWQTRSPTTELLECLKDARRLLTDQDAIDLEYVDAVIAKAEGAVA